MKVGIVAASGPSLSQGQAEQCRGHTCMAVCDAYRLFPFARYLYACDASWWRHHNGVPDFAGERWSSHSAGSDDKTAAAKAYGLKLIKGQRRPGFSLEPGTIHYNGSSGFQALNLMLLWGFNPILAIGFDCSYGLGGRSHFFGEHEKPLRRPGSFMRWQEYANVAAKALPKQYQIINCTPGSALKCFPQMDLEEALTQYASRPA